VVTTYDEETDQIGIEHTGHGVEPDACCVALRQTFPGDRRRRWRLTGRAGFVPGPNMRNNLRADEIIDPV